MDKVQKPSDSDRCWCMSLSDYWNDFRYTSHSTGDHPGISYSPLDTYIISGYYFYLDSKNNRSQHAVVSFLREILDLRTLLTLFELQIEAS
jgi:hypothetical protein